MIGTLMGIGWALVAGLVVHGGLKAVTSLRLTLEEDTDGADLSIHRIGATPEREANWGCGVWAKPGSGRVQCDA